MKRAIVLSGVSGTGKTHVRTTDPELKHLPFVDIADVYRSFPEFAWQEAYETLLKEVLRILDSHSAVVIEGYFLRGSVTRRWLRADLKRAGIKIEMREFWAPIDVCTERIAEQYENSETSAAECKRRIELLKECWRPR